MLLYFFRNFGFLLLLNVLIKPVWVFLVDIPVQNAIGHELYGLYYTAFNFSMMLSILADMGLNHFNNINLSDQTVERSYSFASLLPAKMLLSLGYILVAVLVGMIVFDQPGMLYFIFLTSIFHAATVGILFLRTYLSSSRRFRRDSFFSVSDRLFASIVLLLVLYVYRPDSFTVEYFIFTQIFAAFFTISLLFITLYRSEKIALKLLPDTWNWIRSTLPYSLLILLMAIYTRVDSTLIQLLLGSKAAGMYAASYRLIDFLSQFGYLSSVILLPLFAHLKKEESSLNKLFISVTFIIFFVANGITVCLMFGAEFFSDFLYKEVPQEISGLFKIHLIAFPFIVANFVVGSYITAFKYLRFLIAISAVGIVVQLIGNLLLIPSLGLNGAAYVMLLTHAWIFLAQLVWIVRRHGLHKDFTSAEWALLLTGTVILPFLLLSSVVMYGLMLLCLVAVSYWLLMRASAITRYLKVIFSDRKER